MNTSRGEKVKRPEMKLREGSTQSAIITLRKVTTKNLNIPIFLPKVKTKESC